MAGRTMFESFPSLSLALVIAMLTTFRLGGPGPARPVPSSQRVATASSGASRVATHPGIPSSPASSARSEPSTSAAPTKESTPASLAGVESLQALGLRLVEGFGALDLQALHQLTPTSDEYHRLLYPELVRAGNPVLEKLGPDWGYDNMDKGSREGLRKAFKQLGRKQKLSLVSIDAEPMFGGRSLVQYGNVRLHAKDERGTPIDLPFVATLVEQGGRFKVMRYRLQDRD